MPVPPTSAPIALFSCAFTGLCPSSTKTGLNRRLHLAAALSSCASTRGSAVMRNCSALRLRLAPDGGFAKLFLSASISQQVWASGEQYVWPEVPRRTGSSSGFGDLMSEL